MKKGVEVYIAIFIAVIVVIAGLVCFYYFNKEICQDLECFQEEMRACTKAVYINEEPEASWFYEISGSSGGLCEVNVKLIQAKEGDLEIDKLSGYEMYCSYPLGSVAYPEKDLTRCHGRLKEELQGVIIKKLHTHIIENLGKVDASLEKAL